MNIKPTDTVPTLIWYQHQEPNSFHAWAEPNPDRHEHPCDVFWGSHGCSRPHGHSGDHWCDCCDCDNHPDPDSGCVAGPPYYGPDTTFFGDDANT